jgi:hypothetical protein
MWVATGVGTNTMLTSSNGYDWSTSGLTGSTFSIAGYGAAWNGNKWIAVGQGGNPILNSSDGLNWLAGATGTLFTNGHGIAWNGSNWLAVGFGNNQQILMSTDGINWRGISGSLFGNNGYGLGVTWNGSLWVIVGGATPRVATTIQMLTGDGNTIYSTTGGLMFTDLGYGVASNNIWATTPSNSTDAMNKFLQNYYLRFGPI